MLAVGRACGAVRDDLPASLQAELVFALLQAMDRWSLRHMDEFDKAAIAGLAHRQFEALRRLLATDADRTVKSALEQPHGLEQRRFARTAGTKQRDDLTRRDALEIVLGKWHEPLRDKVLRLIGQADHEFFIRTHADTYGVLPRHIRVNRSSAWWWHRVPSASSHTDFLEVGRRDRS